MGLLGATTGYIGGDRWTNTTVLVHSTMGLDRQQARSATRVRQSVLDLKVAALIASPETPILKVLRESSSPEIGASWMLWFEQASFQVDRVAISA